VGRFLPGPGDELPKQVHLVRDDGVVGAETTVAEEGTFVLQASLRRHCRNEFRVRATGADGGDVPLATPVFAIVHGISVADPPLSRSIGIALADDSVHQYFKKGTPLPARKTFVHQTIKSVSDTGGEEALSVPIVQGEFHRAHRNCLIGSLSIGGVVGCALPAGSRVEVTLHLDRSGQMHARADIPSIGRTFDNVVHILVPTASLETLEKGLATVEFRADNLLRRAFRVSDIRSARSLDQVPVTLVEARHSLDAAKGGDDDAAQRLRRLLLEIENCIDGVEEALEWPNLVNEANDRIEIAISWVSAWGTPSEQALLDRAITSARTAFETQDPLELDRQVKAIRNLTNAAFTRDPRSVYLNFDWYTENLASATDVSRATELVNRGRKAAEKGDAEALKNINRQLDVFFPGTEEERRRSFDSGIC